MVPGKDFSSETARSGQRLGALQLPLARNRLSSMKIAERQWELCHRLWNSSFLLYSCTVFALLCGGTWQRVGFLKLLWQTVISWAASILQHFSSGLNGHRSVLCTLAFRSWNLKKQKSLCTGCGQAETEQPMALMCVLCLSFLGNAHGKLCEFRCF